MLNLGITKLSLAKPAQIFDRFVPDGLSHAATSFVESLKINSISERTRRGRRVIVKSRNIYGRRVAELINFYFRMAGTGIRYVSDVRQWARWEKQCFELLNGTGFHAAITDSATVTLDKLPGKSLWDHMNDGSLTLAMLAAAGKEYRRAHALRVRAFSDGWSHGDASMTNVIYDQKTRRARLIDFEIMHEKSLTGRARHADDLLVFLLDMVDRASSRHWLSYALAFLRPYENPDVLAELRRRLIIPRGLALIWWNVRTNFAKAEKVRRRFKFLQTALARLEQQKLYEADRARSSRRPSISCHASRPGTPTNRSRKRVIREIAKAVSPGMPRTLPSRT